MELQKEIKDRWNSSADGYNLYIQEELNSFKKEAWIELILENENKDSMNILDVGTGPGFFSIILSQRGHKLTGIDCTENMIKVAKNNSKICNINADFFVMDSHELDFEDNTFDMIVSRNVTWTLYDPKKAYKEWLRVLKPNGKLIIFDANWQLHYFDKELEKKVKASQYEYSKKYGEPFESCTTEIKDEVEKSLPLSDKLRPHWDIKNLGEIGYKNIEVDNNIIDRIYDEKEMMLYGCTPSFKLTATK